MFLEHNNLGFTSKYFRPKPVVLWSVFSKINQDITTETASAVTLSNASWMILGCLGTFAESGATLEPCLVDFLKVLCSWFFNLKFYGFSH